MTDSATADRAAPDRTTRRALFGAGVVGAALALANQRTASAAAPGLSADDLRLVGFAIGLELTARDLYDAAIEAGATGAIWEVLSEHHESYAQLLAGVSGISANDRNDDVFDALVGGFRSATSQTAFELENVAAATHTDLLSRVTDGDAAGGIASIAAMESRHATVLAGLAGSDDMDSLFSNTAESLATEV